VRVTYRFFFNNNIHYYTHVGLFSKNTIVGVEITCSGVKEPCSKCVVIEIKKLLLRMDVDGEEHELKKMGFEKNVGQQ
jgi:hypothetical protein